MPDPELAAQRPLLGSLHHRRGAVLIAALAVGLVGALVLLLAISSSQQGIGLNIVGQQSPPIEGPTLDGGSYNLDHHLGKWVVVNFFATWCVGCIEEYPELVKFHQFHADVNNEARTDVELVTVVYSDTSKNVRNSVIAGAPWPVVLSENRSVTGKIAVSYSVTKLPETYIISPRGVVVKKLIGASGVTVEGLNQAIALASQELAAATGSLEPAPGSP